MRHAVTSILVLAMGAAAHIKPGSLNVKSGTIYTAGQKVTLSWSASVDHNKSNYNLWFSADAGKTWTSVKTGIPGAATNVPVNYEWTVPGLPTKTGMVRVFQTFGGVVASDPSRPGDYTLFSPPFEIAAATGVAARAAAAPLRVVGGAVLVDPAAWSASGPLRVERLSLDGSVQRVWVLDAPAAGSSPVRIDLSGEHGAARLSVIRLLSGARVLAQAKLAPNP